MDHTSQPILVTGANGFIGSQVVRTLTAAGHTVRAMVQPGTPTGDLAGLPVELVTADLTAPESLRAAARDTCVCIHLAAVARDWGPWELFHRVNVEGTRALLDACIAADVTRFVLVSSIAVHAYSGHADSDEDSPRDGCALPYGRSKIAAEDIVRAAHDDGRIEGVVTRPALVPFGPRDRQAFVPLAQALRRAAVPLVDGGQRAFTTSYVENLADGLTLAALHPGASGGTYLLTDGRVVTWREYLTAAATALDAPAPRTALPSWLAAPAAAAVEDAWRVLHLPGGPPLTRYRIDLFRDDLVFRSDRALHELGYRPRVGLEEGLRRTAEWFVREQEA